MNNDIFGKNGMLFLDGAMGTQLQARGLKPGEVPELWNLARADDVRAVHENYFAAGADIVYANTFGANSAKYHGDAPLADVVAAGVAIAKEAAARAGGRRFVALDVGPTGRLLKPAGDFEFDVAYDAFAEQVRLGAAAGADLVAVETMGDLYELKAAVLAAKENSNLPVLATVALGEDGKLLTGADVDCVAALLEGLHADAIGLNCGFGPDRMLEFVRRLAARTSLPIVVKPNAGLPKVVDGRTVFTVGPEEFARDVAAGMLYLSSLGIVHRDLASRNILLKEDLDDDQRRRFVAKVSDFGLSRVVTPQEGYYRSESELMPIQWSAPEALRHKRFSAKTDV